LDQLSAEELRRLNSWLAEHGLPMPDHDDAAATADTPVSQTVAPAVPVAQPAYGERAQVPDVLSSISGDFRGWEGDTVFQLDNGQVYQQRRPGRWKTKLTDPVVRVRKSFLGYELEVEDHSIGVKRLR
ncbi:MAG: hypothetical protein ACO3R5_06785, partial [Pseudohongiellaceae bacterium]